MYVDMFSLTVPYRCLEANNTNNLLVISVEVVVAVRESDFLSFFQHDLESD